MPRWRRDGKELFFVGGNRKLFMSAAVDGHGDAFNIGTVQPLFPSNLRQVGFGGANAVPYDVSPDGQRFLMLTTPEDSAATPIVLVVNWTGLVKK
jgi:hypothetical protein